MNPMFFKQYAHLIIAGIVAVALFSAGWVVKGWRDSYTMSDLNNQIAELKIERANTAALQANGALKDLADATASINSAAKRYGATQDYLSEKIDDLKKDIKNEIPLPPDCVLDASRMRRLKSGIDTTNKAITGNKAIRALPAN